MVSEQAIRSANSSGAEFDGTVVSDGGSRPSSAKVAGLEGSAILIVPERLTGKNQSRKQSVATVVQRGNFFRALTTIKGKNTGPCWIIDSGASDHMTDDISLFANYTPAKSRLTVKIADASDSLVAGSGTINVSATLTLHGITCSKVEMQFVICEPTDKTGKISC